jgi:hypothetical protein
MPPCLVHLDDSSIQVRQAPVSISNLKLQVWPTRMTSTIEIENVGVTPVNAVFAVLNFYSSDHYLVGMTFFLATSDEALHPAAPFSPLFTSAEPLSHSMLPGDKDTLSGYSPSHLAACPERASIGLLQIGLSKGPPFESRAQAWRTDPYLVWANAWSIKNLPKVPSFVLMHVSVDEGGTMRVLGWDDVSRDLAAVVKNQIEKGWRFGPATYEGSPIASDLALYFRFAAHENDCCPLPIVPADWRLVGGLVIVDVVPEPDPVSYTIYYGGERVASGESRPERSSRNR